MLKLNNVTFSFLLESVVKMYNSENNTDFDSAAISQECSRVIMGALQKARSPRREIVSKDGRFHFSTDDNYLGLSDSYLYKKGKEVRMRKLDIPIQTEEKYIELFTEYLGFQSVEEFLDYANRNLVSRQKVNIKIPSSLIVPIQQYLLFFKEYTKSTKGIEIKLSVDETNEGIEIIFDVPPPLSPKEVNGWFSEYMMLLRDNMDNSEAEYSSFFGNSKSNEQELFILRLQNEIEHLKMSLKFAELEKKMLSQSYEDIKTIALELSSKETVIHNQYIQDGNQQFANSINNK